MNRNRVLLFLPLFLFALVSSVVMAQPATEDVTVDVSILSTAEITVLPSSLSWSSVSPGTAGGNKSLNVKNVGSTNVSQIYAYVDTLTDEITRPYGSDNAADYAVGSVITLINETSGEKYYFAGRLEWNWTEAVSNSNFTNINNYNAVAWGFFRNTSQDYFWGLGNGTGGLCNNTDTVFGIDTNEDDGTMSTRTPVTTTINRDGGDANYSYFSVNDANSPLYGYCVAVNATCDNIYIYKYDRRAGFQTCANSRYLRENNLAPYDTEDISVDVFVPRGMPDGSMNTATLTFAAS